MVLKRKRQLVRARFVGRTDVMAGWAGGLNVVLREDAVVKDGDARRPSQFPRCVEARAVPDDVVGLPLAGCARSIHQRRILAVHGGGLPVRVRFAVVGIEHLDFVAPHQENAAVPSILIFSFGRIGFAEFDVKLTVAERFLGTQVAGLAATSK